jgi:hypothetical protein
LYGGDEAVVSIETGEVMEGELPRATRRLVQEWALRYHAELIANWDRSRQGLRQPLERIPGLDVTND